MFLCICISLILNFSVKFIGGFSGLPGSHLYLDDLQLFWGIHFDPRITSKSLFITEILINAQQVPCPGNRSSSGQSSVEMIAVI